MTAVKRRAVLDLGTNTFHLLIADFDENGQMTEVFRERHFVKLAADGIDLIGAAPFARGLATLAHFRQKMDAFGAPPLRALGTAALRKARNGDDFRAQAAAILGTPVELISGDEEARLITIGVLASLPPLTERVLIMDIGGGSTEFIIADADGVRWRRSFEFGISSLLDRWHTEDPIPTRKIVEMNAWLTDELQALLAELRVYETRHLVGAAGTFEILAEQFADARSPKKLASQLLDLTGFAELTERMAAMTHPERLATPWVPEQRADMLVVALLLIKKVLALTSVTKVTVSAYSLKEGALRDDV
jgi:exopolyphosphatase/guanosine-5'-triphosphate,3'-diphosphate pyrophosphatase